MAASFFATLESELLKRQTFQTQREARPALFDSIAVFYNRQRRHSALDYLSPDAYEPDAYEPDAYEPDAYERRYVPQTSVVA